MLDLHGVYEIINEFRVPTRKLVNVDEGTGQEALKSLSVRFWYENLRKRTGLYSAYGLEQYFEPDSFRRDPNDSISQYRNKWIRYEDGMHRPQSELLKLVEKKCPGSARDLDHPLWRVLDARDLKVLRGDQFLRTLGPGVQSAIFTPEGDSPFAQSARMPVNHVVLNRLQRKANLDALACLIWLLRESVQLNTAMTDRISVALHRVLIMMTMDLQALRVGRSLVTLVLDNILRLPMAAHQRLALSAEQYLEASVRLNALVYRTPHCQGKSLTWSQRTKVMGDMLDFKYGFDIFFAMGRPFLINAEAPGLSESQRALAVHEEKRWRWGWDCLRRNRQGDAAELE